MRIPRRKSSTHGGNEAREIKGQPDYHTELPDDYLDAMQRDVDGKKPEGFRLTPISEPGW